MNLNQTFSPDKIVLTGHSTQVRVVLDWNSYFWRGKKIPSLLLSAAAFPKDGVLCQGGHIEKEQLGLYCRISEKEATALTKENPFELVGWITEEHRRLKWQVP